MSKRLPYLLLGQILWLGLNKGHVSLTSTPGFAGNTTKICTATASRSNEAPAPVTEPFLAAKYAATSRHNDFRKGRCRNKCTGNCITIMIIAFSRLLSLNGES